MKVRSLHLLGMTFDVVVHEGGLCIHLAATSVAGGRTGSKASKACSGAASARIVFYCLKNEILRSAQDDVNVLESTKVDFKANGISSSLANFIGGAQARMKSTSMGMGLDC